MELIGRGNTAEVFALDDKKVWKVFYEGFSECTIKGEFDNGMIVQEFQLPIPKVYELRNMDQRMGIIYERLYGTTLLDLLTSGGDVNYIMDQMVDLHKLLLACHTRKGKSYKESLRGFIRNRLPKDAPLWNEIDALPDGDTICHGDYHPGNVYQCENGECRIIDFMNICYGPWQYDVARSYFLLTDGELPEDVPNKEELMQMRILLGKMYLSKMQVSLEELEPYIHVIRECRYYEIH
ncbi:aminoglycoside phosphotransferase family protein [Anaerosporobacter faecicola]|uniref:aminoglycoside phosphotransferase family protein n=1 Tax=Anaerosporobacter faecicola TaxID=2718714 RepID=UPI00143923E3|nr:aminoglycoside phosphotransferase family protein [Anaerosporobacter faecicola]